MRLVRRRSDPHFGDFLVANETRSNAITHQLGKESQRLKIFDDVAVFVGDDEEIQVLNRLVQVTNVLCLDEGVLCVL